MESASFLLPCTDIVLDPTLQPRVNGVDADHIRALEDSHESWPPIVVVKRGGHYVLVDGFHRVAAAQNVALEVILARAVDMPEDGDLHGLAFQLNAAHGRPLSLADRRTFAAYLLQTQTGLADREIGRRAGLSSNTVGGIREQLEKTAQIEQTTERVGQGGYTYSVGANPKERQPGELPDIGFGESMNQVFSSTERKQQRQIANYLQRVAHSLNDQFDLEGWESNEEAAASCRLVLGEERATALGRALGDSAFDILEVASLLGYDSNMNNE